MAQNLQKMFCPSCGSPISFIEGRESTFCQYCGYQIFREDDQLEMKLHHEQKKWFFQDRHEDRTMEYSDRHEEREYRSEDIKQILRDRKEERKLRKYEARQKNKGKLLQNPQLIEDIILVIILIFLLLYGASL